MSIGTSDRPSATDRLQELLQHRPFLSALVLISLLGACAEDLGDAPPTRPTDGGPPDGAPPVGARVVHADLGGGVTETRVDGTDTAGWVLIDLDTDGGEVDADPTTDLRWDLAIQRYHVRVNGGAGGPGRGRVAVLDGVALAAVDRAPAAGWRRDEPPSPTEIPDDVPMGSEPPPTTVISGGDDPWYTYDSGGHLLSPKERVYVVESSAGRYFALQLVDYYSPRNGEAGWPAFQWKAIEPPVAPPGLRVDASASDAWVYLTLEGDPVVLADPASSTGWDLALRRTALRTNGGVSGPGEGGAKRASEDWAEVVATDSSGFERDTLRPLPGPPGSGEAPANEVLEDWYDYDPATHGVSARPADTYVVRGARGDYAKLRILEWDDGVFRVELSPVHLEPEVHLTTLDASSTAHWVGFDFERGQVSADWDLAIRRTAMATDSGSSGSGDGGAADAGDADFDRVTVPPGTFVVDEELPLPGPPGSGTFSGNPALADWYDYDPVAHTVIPKARVYVVRTRRGDYAKMRITRYAEGVFDLQWLYAGAGRSDFPGAE